MPATTAENHTCPPRRRLRCTIIGAGVSGILMGYKLREHLKDYVDFQIFEKSPDLGGTWYENRYPGCGCDVPSHCYQYSFAPNPNWSRFYASSQEINSYLKGVAAHFELEQFIRYNSKVISAEWSNESSTWTVRIENGPAVESEVLVNAGGILNNPQMPDIEGLSAFPGSLLHTADWDSSVDLRNKKIGVVGSGASAIQLLPQIQPLADKIQVYIRTPSWICPPMALPDGATAYSEYEESEKENFRSDEEAYLETRKGMEDKFNCMFRAFLKDSPEQRDIRAAFEARMRSLIPNRELQENLIPSFEVGCRRINPGEGFLVALQKQNVEPVFHRIEKVTAEGIIAGGVLRPADVLVAATGFNTTFRPRFAIIGLNEVNLQDAWSESPASYMGTGVAGFPNYLIFLGPNTPISNGSLMGPLEATSDYFIRILRKMIRQRIRSFNVRTDAQKDFNAHVQTSMQDMVWTGTCRSWFKGGGGKKVTALWPGSSLHYMQVLAENRWEDYDWEYEGERYAYWGQGISWVESPELDPLGIEEQEDLRTATTIPRKGSDLSFYLWKGPPLPHSCIPSFQDGTSQLRNGDDEGVDMANGATGHAGRAVAPNCKANGDSAGPEGKQGVGIAVPV